MLKTMVLHLMLAFFMASQPAQKPAGDVYSAWTQDGLHLMISDAGTPGNYDDDFICDWETNREFTITIHD